MNMNKYNVFKYENRKILNGYADISARLIIYEDGSIEKIDLGKVRIIGSKEDIEKITQELSENKKFFINVKPQKDNNTKECWEEYFCSECGGQVGHSRNGGEMHVTCSYCKRTTDYPFAAAIVYE